MRLHQFVEADTQALVEGHTALIGPWRVPAKQAGDRQHRIEAKLQDCRQHCINVVAIALATTNSNYGSMYGIAAYENKGYGFSHQGFIVSIDNNDGAACLAVSTGSDEWAGAAITTLAPVQPPTTN